MPQKRDRRLGHRAFTQHFEAQTAVQGDVVRQMREQEARPAHSAAEGGKLTPRANADQRHGALRSGARRVCRDKMRFVAEQRGLEAIGNTQRYRGSAARPPRPRAKRQTPPTGARCLQNAHVVTRLLVKRDSNQPFVLENSRTPNGRASRAWSSFAQTRACPSALARATRPDQQRIS